MKKQVMVLAVAAVFAGGAQAAVSADEAKQLGGATLTPFGAEKGANKDGTIPEYKAEIIKGTVDKASPGNYTVDPWNDKPLYSINAQNAANYAGKLDGMTEIFKKYPSYRMDIYPTRRTAQFPKFVLDNTIKNATSCKTVNGEMLIEGCYAGMPFPIPKTGAEVMWNHLLAYESHAQTNDFQSWLVASNGSATLVNTTKTVQLWPWYDPDRKSTNTAKDNYWLVRVDITAPARRVGEKIVFIDALDQVNLGRRAYQYVPGQRRVKLAPDIRYDTPSPFGGGAKTMDDSKTFLGAIDRYDWKLVGKKEKYLVYNAFATSDYKKCPPEVFNTKNFPNPNCMRWELHRTWVVEASLKPGFRHIYKKRKFYFDEDGYAAGTGENYDASGALYRTSDTVFFPLLNVAENTASQSIVLDMQTGAWVVEGFFGGQGLGSVPIKAPDVGFFSPEALAGEGVR